MPGVQGDFRDEGRVSYAPDKPLNCWICSNPIEEIVKNGQPIGHTKDDRWAHALCLLVLWYTGRPPVND